MFNRHTLTNISREYKKDVKTIHKYFDVYEDKSEFPDLSKTGKINLMFDGTYFARNDGYLVFRANNRNIHAIKIKSERIDIIKDQLGLLESKGYEFKSFAIDGRRGVCKMLETIYPGVPIQFCQFHQKMIIRRYITNNPKLECSKELKALVKEMGSMTENNFRIELEKIQKKYDVFLKEKNEKRKFMHKRLRSAFRSLRTNLPYLFTYKNHLNLGIPNTTNSIESSFSQWKPKVRIHKGLRADRKDKMILYLIKSS